MWDPLDFQCLICRSSMDGSSFVEGESICSECRRGVAALPEDLAQDPRHPSTRALYSYDGSLTAALWRLKFQGDPRGASLLASFLWAAPAGAAALRDKADIIMPVPLHPLREWSRGYNQCEEILRWARNWAHIRGIPMAPIVTGVLRRRRMSASQRGQKAWGRRRISKQSFALARGWEEYIPRDAKVLIFDDVLTTGSTLHACQSALAAAGIRHSQCLALLRRL